MFWGVLELMEEGLGEEAGAAPVEGGEGDGRRGPSARPFGCAQDRLRTG